jgi:hypothetical protein
MRNTFGYRDLPASGNLNTRRAYRNDLQEFMGFVGIAAPEEFRLVSRAHVLPGARTLLCSAARRSRTWATVTARDGPALSAS